MALSKRARGDLAEARVDKAARARGWACLARNYTIRGGELDLVYHGAGALIIVEVRYRSHTSYGGAAGSVTQGKQRRIIRAARHFLAHHPRYAHGDIRFDVVGVDDKDNLDWIENAFYAE